MARHASSRVHGFPWKRVYRAATLETNNARLEKRIQTAEATLLARLIDLEGLRENELEIRPSRMPSEHCGLYAGGGWTALHDWKNTNQNRRS